MVHHTEPVHECPASARRASCRVVALGVLPAFLALLSACGAGSAGDRAEGEGLAVHHGPAVSLGNGTARTYVIVDGSAPVEVGVALSEEVLEGLPLDGAPGGVTMPDGHSTFEYVLEMPADNPTPFLHATLDWNPAGHEPPGVYDRAHFDVHFYTIPNEARLAIHPGDPEFMAKAARMPAPEEIPEGYIDPQLGPVPAMGVHWVDPASPELHPERPEPFTRTFIYGSWDGRMIFAEPMVTTEYLTTRPDERIPVAVAARHDPPGYYPGSYVIRWDESAREYRIGLADLVMRQ